MATEALGDVAVEVAPVGRDEARAMTSRLRSARLLGPFRGRGALDVDAVADAIVKVSQLIARHGDRIAELDINPLVVGERGYMAADCLIVAR